ncbi:hypothetical protein [Rhizobacter sp. Root404]|uniref:hypothetical protein n=1 Tax=Rhizobacter sp. Root404 TaxID=1736528 RepID=UPI0006FF93AE|nr:hypothetical protein [Rhizobacter sp. Root404]KQW39954.1 hypothetical protein ASC76_00360 [Rhizobacter sp. Root404]
MGRVDRLRAHHRRVLRCGRAREQLDDVEGDGLRARKRRAPGEAVVEVDAVVEIGSGGVTCPWMGTEAMRMEDMP